MEAAVSVLAHLVCRFFYNVIRTPPSLALDRRIAWRCPGPRLKNSGVMNTRDRGWCDLDSSCNGAKTVPRPRYRSAIATTFDLIYVRWSVIPMKYGQGPHLLDCRHLSHKETIAAVDVRGLLKNGRFEGNCIRPTHVLEPTRSWDRMYTNII